jgi:hypothetical protein
MDRNLAQFLDPSMFNRLLCGLTLNSRMSLISDLIDKAFEPCSPEKVINCIKAVRQLTGLGLKESKGLVEKYRVTRSALTNVRDLMQDLEGYTVNGTSHIPAELAQDLVSGRTYQRQQVDVSALKARLYNDIVADYTDFDDDIPF